MKLVADFPLYNLALRVASQSWSDGIREPDAAARYLLGEYGILQLRYRRKYLNSGTYYAPISLVTLGRYGASHYEGLVTACHELGHVLCKNLYKTDCPPAHSQVQQEEEFCEEFGYALAQILILLYVGYCVGYNLKMTY